MIVEPVGMTINLDGTPVDVEHLFGVASFSASICELVKT